MGYNQINIDNKFLSQYVPLVSLSKEKQDKLDDEFLKPKILDFFKKLNIPPLSTKYIGFDQIITEKEFFKIDMELAKSYFYAVVFDNILKDTKGKVLNAVKYCLTFDIDLTPHNIGNQKYGTISLGEKVVFYYIYLDLQEIIRFIKQD